MFVQQNGWVDEGLLNQWLWKVWFARPGSLFKKKSLLVWDMFRIHLVEKIKALLNSNATRQAVIPGGCTCILQPLDVSLNKPFKGHMHKQWTSWMVKGPKKKLKLAT